jgi:hypothetical protein
VPAKILAEALDVLDLRAAPAVDRLIVVAHGHDGDHEPGQHPQPGVLDRVRVLELIHEDLLEAALVVGQNLRVD